MVGNNYNKRVGKLRLLPVILICFFVSSFITGYSQEEIITDPTGTIVIGTSDSRLVATIIEKENGVIMQVVAVGEMTFDLVEFSFFIKQGELAWSDKNFTATPSYGLLNTSTAAYIEVAPDMLRGGGRGLDFLLQSTCRYREASSTPTENGTSVPGMDALVISIFDMTNRLHLPSGEIKHIFTCYFKKLHPPTKVLQKGDIGIGVKANDGRPGGYFMPKWAGLNRNITYDDNNGLTGTAWQRIRPQFFFYRSPSSVAMSTPGEITSTTAVLNGVFKRGDMSPSNDLLDGRIDASTLRYEGRLNWDEIIQRGFIYTNNATVTSLSVKEYANILIINGSEYPFPNSGEMAAGEFTRGGYTLYIKMATNSNTSGSVNYNLTLTDLAPNASYRAWPIIGYTFETSLEYFKTGDPLSFGTSSDCIRMAPPVADASQSFCGSGTIADLVAEVPAGNELKWFASPDDTTTPIPSTDPLLPAIYYARYSKASAGGLCYSDSAKVAVTLNTGLDAPTANTLQQHCFGDKVSDLQAQAQGSNTIEWYKDQNGGTPLPNNDLLADGIYYASQSNTEGCQTKDRKPVTVQVDQAIDISTPLLDTTYFCSGESQITLKIVASNVRLNYQWYENNRLLTGKTSDLLEITTQGAKGKTYSVVVSNRCDNLTLKTVIGENTDCTGSGSCLDVIEQKRNHTLVVNNDSVTNGGYTFEKYSWYKDNKVIAGKVEVAGGASRGGYYYAGEDKDGKDKQLEAGVYYAEMWDKTGKKYHSCPVTIESKAVGKVSVYPNPLVTSQVVYVDADLDEEALATASIEIYSPLGSYIGKVNVQRLTPVRLPEEKGVYILKFRAEETEENFKVIVK